jgi:tartrate dehydratase beta subunit/fumarate hydratase class I family protein
MLYVRNSLITGVMIVISFTAAAQEIYKTVNEDGVVEYSDMPAPEAKEIEVDPNVVSVTPRKSSAPTSDVSPSEGKEAPELTQESDEVYESDDLVRDRDLAKKRAIENNNQGAERPVHRGPVKKGAHRR